MSEEGEVSEALENEFNAMEGYYGLSTTSSSTSVCEDSSVMAIDYYERNVDAQEETDIRSFDCNCHFGAGKKACSSLLRYEDVMDYRVNCLELSRGELDMVILGQINSQSSPQSHTKFFYKGDRVCMNTFLFLHAISDKRYRNLYKHWENNGLTPKIHGSHGKSPSNATSLETVEAVLTFVRNLAAAMALPLPGRLPNCKDERVVLLPTDMSKMEVYRRYCQASRDDGTQPVGKITFLNLWSKQLLYINVMKPATDLCWDCQQNMALVQRSGNLSEEEKSVRLQAAQNHILLARKQRDHYNAECDECATQWNERDSTRPYKGAMHYSFDYAQQVHFPSNALQPGPLFFKTARKCNVFGVACEPRKNQVNYLIDEADFAGKGANNTLSMVDRYLSNHGVKEEDLRLHADNCVGQNKIIPLHNTFCGES